MSVIFESNIKVNEDGSWYIELIDTSDGESIICNSTDEYEKKYEELSEPYGGMVDEVKWTKSDNLRPDHFDEIRLWMAELQRKADEVEQAHKDQQTAQQQADQGMPL